MSVERKSLFIELFVQSHLVLSSIAEEKLKQRSRTILEFDSTSSSPKIQKVSDYAHHLEYVKDWIIKAFDKSQISSPGIENGSHRELKGRIENAKSGEELFRILENIQH